MIFFFNLNFVMNFQKIPLYTALCDEEIGNSLVHSPLLRKFNQFAQFTTILCLKHETTIDVFSKKPRPNTQKLSTFWFYDGLILSIFVWNFLVYTNTYNQCRTVEVCFPKQTAISPWFKWCYMYRLSHK